MGLTSLIAGAPLAETLKIGDLAQGSEFTKCINVTDYKSKGLDDEVEVTDKTDGSCPDGYTPGSEFQDGYSHKDYWSSMIVCGKFGANEKKCYVAKMDVTCNDGSKMVLNGCCPQGEWPGSCKRGSKCKGIGDSGCSYYDGACTHYAERKKTQGTEDASDDLGTEGLNIANVRAYAPCQDAFNANKAPYPPVISCGVKLKNTGSSGCENVERLYFQRGQQLHPRNTIPGEQERCDLGVTKCITVSHSYEHKGCQHDFAIGACKPESRDCAWYEKKQMSCSMCDGDMCNTKEASPSPAAPSPAGPSPAAPAAPKGEKPSEDQADGAPSPPAPAVSSAQVSDVGVLAALAAISAM